MISKILKLHSSIVLSVFWFLFLPLSGLDREVFYAKLKEPTPQWMIEQIEEDLTIHKTDLSKNSLTNLFAHEDLYLVRVVVAKGKISIQKSKHSEDKSAAAKIIAGLYRLSQVITLPDIDFVFTCHDGMNVLYPIFSISKWTQHQGAIVMPDMFALEGFEPGKSLILEGNRLYPWESKTNVIFYRGADVGVRDLSDWMLFPRPKLVALSVQYPELIDAKFTGLYSPWHSQFALEHGYMGAYVSLKDHASYKYLMSVGAGCATTPRFPLLLHSNSVVFTNIVESDSCPAVVKPITNSILWFYKSLKPYEHFVPVKVDLSDLLTQLDWAKTHDEECKKISENARQLAADVLTEESVYLYLYRLLEAYSNKQRGQYFLE